MPTRIEVYGIEAEWKDEEGLWTSSHEELTFILNMNQEQNQPPAGANPWPAGVAVEIAKDLFPDLKVLEQEDKPEFDEEVTY